MKILLLTKLYPAYEGQKRSEVPYALHYFAKEWERYGHEVRVVRTWIFSPKLASLTKKAKRALVHKSDACVRIEDIRVNRVAVKKMPKMDFAEKTIEEGFYKVKRLIEGGDQPDLLLCHMINPELYIGLLLKKAFGIPLVLTLHTGDMVLLKKKRNLRKFIRVMPLIDRIGFRSEKIQKTFNGLLEEAGCLDGQFVIHSGIEERYILQEQLLSGKIKRRSTKVFVAANFVPLKNLDIVIKAFSVLKDEDLMLEIAGDGPEKAKLKKLADQSQASERIVFLGRLDRECVLQKMKDSDVFAMVSAPETFGLVYLEAMASGCLVIGSKGEGIDGVIQNGVNGYLCAPGNPEELAVVLRQVINLPEEKKAKLLLNAVDTAKRMTQEKMARKYLQTLEEAIPTIGIEENGA